ncbi:MAG: FHA domain-containing protein [Kiritimatiellae bacterium]|nr:FHA domain-containing protein [Kiritimatiellia bacterium]
MAKRPQLLVMTGPLTGTRLNVEERGLRVGRSSSNDIHFLDEELSRNHCLFEQDGEDGIRIIDLASANGTFVNSVQLGADARRLQLGDVIEAGSTVFKVVEEGAPAPVTARVSADTISKEGAGAGATGIAAGDEFRARIDLGLGADSGDEANKNSAGDKNEPKRAALANILWGVAAALAILTIALVLVLPEDVMTTSAAESEIAAPAQSTKTQALSYEFVNADTTHIYRLETILDRSGALRVTAVDVPGKDRFVDESVKLSESELDTLDAIFADEEWDSLDSVYAGNPVSSENAMKSYRIVVLRGTKTKDVLVENRDEPEAFRRVREKLWAFVSTKLPVDGIQYTKEKLIELAAESESLGDAKWRERDVAWGNISEAIDAWKKAEFRLRTVNPKPASYEKLLEKRRAAEEELSKRYTAHRQEANIAKGTRKWDDAIKELNIIRELVPDRNDSRHSEAEAEINLIQSTYDVGTGKGGY